MAEIEINGKKVEAEPGSMKEAQVPARRPYLPFQGFDAIRMLFHFLLLLEETVRGLLPLALPACG